MLAMMSTAADLQWTCSGGPTNRAGVSCTPYRLPVTVATGRHCRTLSCRQRIVERLKPGRSLTCRRDVYCWQSRPEQLMTSLSTAAALLHRVENFESQESKKVSVG